MKYCIMLFLFIAIKCHATDYHVAATGSDSNGCTDATTDACLTPEFGASKLTVAGDTLYIHSGTYNVTGNDVYNATIYPRASGTSGERITIQAWPGDTVTLDGGSAPTEGIIGNKGQSGLGYDYITIKGLIIKGLVLLLQGDHVILEDCDISVGGDSDPGINFGHVVFAADGTGIIIRNNKLHDNTIQSSVNNSPLLMSYDTVGLVVEKNDIYNSVGYGVFLKDSPNNATVKQNHIYDNASAGFSTSNQDDTTDVFIHNNIFRNNNTSDGVENGDIEFTGHVDGIFFYNNTVVSPSTAAILVKGYAGLADINVYNNIFYNVGSRFYYNAYDARFAVYWTYSDYNTFYGTGSWTDASTWTTLASYQSGNSEGFDALSISTDPSFVDDTGTDPEDFKRTSYPENGRGGAYSDVMGAYVTGAEIIGYVNPIDITFYPVGAGYILY